MSVMNNIWPGCTSSEQHTHRLVYCVQAGSQYQSMINTTDQITATHSSTRTDGQQDGDLKVLRHIFIIIIIHPGL